MGGTAFTGIQDFAVGGKRYRELQQQEQFRTLDAANKISSPIYLNQSTARAKRTLGGIFGAPSPENIIGADAFKAGEIATVRREVFTREYSQKDGKPFRTDTAGDSGKFFIIEDQLRRNKIDAREIEDMDIKQLAEFDPRFLEQSSRDKSAVESQGREFALFDLVDRHLVDMETGKRYKMDVDKIKQDAPYLQASNMFKPGSLIEFTQKAKPVDLSSRKTEEALMRDPGRRFARNVEGELVKTSVQADPKEQKVEAESVPTTPGGDKGQVLGRDIDRRGGPQKPRATSLLADEDEIKKLLGG